MDYYIYYRVRRENSRVLHERVAAMQQRLANQQPITVALKRRPEEIDGVQTWMELYLGVPDSAADDFHARLASTLEQSELSSMIEGKRHIECFMEFAPCA